MQSNLELLEANKVKLSVELDEKEFDEAVAAAFRRLAREVKIPGFRPGKAPRQLLEARLGSDVARKEALRDSLPDFYEKALQEHDVEPIAPPDIDITSGRESGPVAFDAVVEVMPKVQIGGYEGLRVVLPNFGVTEEELDAQVDRLREQFAELNPVSRPAAAGDNVSIDRRVYRNDETLQVAEDELYEVGKGTMGPQLDQQLTGAKAGDILKFNVDLGTDPPEDVTFQVLVKEVREKILPEVTDEWASEASEYDTVEELRADLYRRTDAVKRLQAAMTVREKVLEAVAELVTDEMPEALVMSELDRRSQMLAHRLSHQGADLSDYLSATGKSADDLIAELREESARSIKIDLALRAVVEAESIEVSESEVDEELAAMALRQEQKPADLKRRLADEGRLPAVLSEIRKAKAVEWLTEHTEYVDEDGRVIDRSELEPQRPEAESPESDSPESEPPTESDQETAE
ncbi:MAG TPA: trigger factor [Acidimicrobiales bacterium]|nr:trigger factor [Acidimicrobiales bacterium]